MIFTIRCLIRSLASFGLALRLGLGISSLRTMSLDSLRFDHLVRDLEVDEMAFAREIQLSQPPSRTYVIVFTPRSGSSWLTNILAATGQLGDPQEFINPDFVRDVAKSVNARAPAALLQILQRRLKSSNGVFGMEVRAVDVMLLGEPVFLQNFGPATIFFNLWRENIVAQAISLYRAIATQRFHSSDAAGSTQPPAYDGAKIQNWLSHIADTETSNLAMLRRIRRSFITISYEEIVKDRDRTLKFFADTLRVTLSGATRPASGELTKIADDWNDAAEQRFRAEYADWLAGIEALREMKSLPQALVSPAV
jgi:LPS sulfotransferase NodH